MTCVYGLVSPSPTCEIRLAEAIVSGLNDMPYSKRSNVVIVCRYFDILPISENLKQTRNQISGRQLEELRPELSLNGDPNNVQYSFVFYVNWHI